MNKVEKINEYVELYDTYKNMFTDSQKLIFEKYYFEDLTLQEIADENNVSKNAIHDSLKKSEKFLINIEEKIGFLKFKNENK